MILIITHKEDYTADFVIDKLNRNGIDYFRFNCEDILETNFSIRFGQSHSLIINNQQEFSSVWYRRTKLPALAGFTHSERIYLLNEIDIMTNNLFACIQAKWLSNPIAVAAAENKFLQLKIAKEIGFNIPNTLVTTDRKKLISFFKTNKKTIIKPVGMGRVEYSNNTSKLIFSNILDDTLIGEIESFEITPAIYQEYIEKEYEIRATVIGKEIYAASVNSQSKTESSVDWRKSKMKFEKYLLPYEIEQKCFLLLEKLNLSFGAFDLIKSTDGQYYFIEVNPNGQWVWIEKDTGQPIAESIIKFLL